MIQHIESSKNDHLNHHIHSTSMMLSRYSSVMHWPPMWGCGLWLYFLSRKACTLVVATSVPASFNGIVGRGGGVLRR